MLWIQPWLGKIRIRIFDQRILIAMPKLFLQPDISICLVMFHFAGAFFRVLILLNSGHDSTSL